MSTKKETLDPREFGTEVIINDSIKIVGVTKLSRPDSIEKVINEGDNKVVLISLVSSDATLGTVTMDQICDYEKDGYIVNINAIVNNTISQSAINIGTSVFRNKLREYGINPSIYYLVDQSKSVKNASTNQEVAVMLNDALLQYDRKSVVNIIAEKEEIEIDSHLFSLESDKKENKKDKKKKKNKKKGKKK